MKSWPVRYAKARFSELLRICRREGPQLVTHRGEKAAVLVPVEDWENLSRARKPTLKELLLAESPRREPQHPAPRQVASAPSKGMVG